MSEVNISIETIQANLGVSVETVQPSVGIQIAGGGSGIDFTTDNTLILDENNVLRVNTTFEMEQDNTLPITSAGVYATVGNIEELLKTI